MSDQGLRELLVARMSEALDEHGHLADGNRCECGYVDPYGSIGLHQLEAQADAVIEMWTTHCICGADYTGEAPDERPDCPQHGVGTPVRTSDPNEPAPF